MKLKLLALLTVVASAILIIMVFAFEIPITYVPENSSTLEFVFYTISFVIVEIVVLVGLFIHMLKTADVDMSDFEGMFHKV